MESEKKFLRSVDYDNILNDILTEPINYLGLLKAIFQNQKEINPEFFRLMMKAIERRKQPIYSKYIEVIKDNPTFQPYELNPLLSLEKSIMDLVDQETKINEQKINELLKLEFQKPPGQNIPEKRERHRPKGTAEHLEDYLTDRDKYECIIKPIKTEYQKDGNRNLVFMVMVLSEMGIFDKRKTENTTNLTKVLQSDFFKSSYSHLSNIKKSINIKTDQQSKHEFEEHKRRLIKIIKEQEIE